MRARRRQSRWAIAIINRQIDNLHFDLGKKASNVCRSLQQWWLVSPGGGGGLCFRGHWAHSRVNWRLQSGLVLLSLVPLPNAFPSPSVPSFLASQLVSLARIRSLYGLGHSTLSHLPIYTRSHPFVCLLISARRQPVSSLSFPTAQLIDTLIFCFFGRNALIFV